PVHERRHGLCPWSRRHDVQTSTKEPSMPIRPLRLLLTGLSPLLLLVSCEFSHHRDAARAGTAQALSQTQDQGPDQCLDIGPGPDQDPSQAPGPDLRVSVACAPAPAGVVAWYSGDTDGSDLIHANNGTASGGVTIVPGEVGNAFLLDGNTGALG